jgi:hypothetical protein
MHPTRRFGSAWILVAAIAGCGRSERAASPRPEARGDPVPTVDARRREPPFELTWTPEPDAPARLSETPHSAVIEVRLATHLPTVDIAAIPSFDRRPEPTPESRTEQLARCMAYRVVEDSGVSFSDGRVRLQVKAHNSCATWIPVSDSWFEVEAAPLGGNAAPTREIGRFQAAIGPLSSADTAIEIGCPGGGRCRYAARVTSPPPGPR